MIQPIHSEPRAGVAERGGDIFGQWLDTAGPPPGAGQKPPPDAPPSVAGGARSTDPDVLALRAARAGEAALPPAATAPAVHREDLGSTCGEDLCPRAAFQPLERPAAVAAVLLTALIVVGGYAIHGDSLRMVTLRGIQEQNQRIHEYNHTRNVLVQHLAKSHDARLGQLRSYAESAQGQPAGQGVIVYVPAGGSPIIRAVPKLRLESAPEDLPDGAEDVQEWTPPPVLESYDQLRYDAEELAGSRAPVAATLVLALVALAAWSGAAHRNLPALRAEPSCFRPGTVAFWWLAPVGNLYFPCAIMREIWHGSDPRGFTRPTAMRLPVIGLWWLVLLGSIGLFAVAAWQMATAVGIDAMASAGDRMLYADIAVAASGLLTLALIAVATWNQGRRRQLIHNFQMHLPPQEAWHRED